MSLRFVLHLLHVPCKGSTPAPPRTRTNSFQKDPIPLLVPASLRPHPFWPCLLLTAWQTGKVVEKWQRRWKQDLGEGHTGPERACKGLPALLLQSPCYPLYLMEPVQDPLVHLQDVRGHKSAGPCSYPQQTVSGALAVNQGAGRKTISWPLRGCTSCLIPSSAPRPPTKW